MKSRHFTSTSEIMSAMKEMFRDVVQTALGMELDEELGWERCQRVEVSAWQNRPLEKVYPFVFMDAIHYKVKEDHRYVTKAAYPQSRLQRCIVHQIRSSTRFVNWKDRKQVMADLKKTYTDVTLDEAEDALLRFGEKWRKQ